jgi:hypothetical protein
VPIQQRKQLGQHHIDITPGTRVLARDGEMRIPAEWVERADESAAYVAYSLDGETRRTTDTTPRVERAGSVRVACVADAQSAWRWT